MVRADRTDYWRRTALVAFATLFFAFSLLLLLNRLAGPLNASTLYGFPLGYLVAVLVVPFVFVLLTFWFAARQDDLDRQHGTAEDD